MPRITLRDHKVHYQQTGIGPDIVLVHGLSCNIAFWWFHIAQHLAATHRVTAVDLRGHGFSGMTENGYRAVDLASDLAALLDHLGIQRAHLVAHSFGGAVAAALSVERPDLVCELTLAEAWLPSLQPIPPLPASGEWTATRARAHACGIEVDQHLPLVVRALYTELLDENEFQTTPADQQAHASDNFGWEDVAPRPQPGFREPPANGPRRPGDFWQRPFGANRGLWAGQGSRWFGRAAESDIPATSSAGPLRPAGTEGPKTPALQGAMMMAGAPGKPSQGIRRWQELMARTHARTEFLDATSIEPPRLQGIEAPVRLVYGARSQYRQSAEALETLLPQSKLQIVPRAAHYFPLLRPQALIHALADSIEASKNRPAAHLSQGKDGPRLRLIATLKSDGLDAPDRTAVRRETGTDSITFPPASGAPRA